MATAYAALASLMNILNRVRHPTSLASLDKSQIQSLFDKVSSLIHLLEADSLVLTNDSKTKIVASAFATGDTIQSHLLRIQNSTSNGEQTSFSLFSQVLDQAIQEMDRIIQETVQAKQNNGEHAPLTTSSLPIGSPPVHRSHSVNMVGLDEEMNRLMGQLTSHESSRQIIPIVGMGGLGKTTLATNVYNHPYLRLHFAIKAWVTISQVYTPRTVFTPLLRYIGIHDTDQIKDEELGEKLHKGLRGRTYLIIIDDLRDVDALDEIIRFCPENNNGSRILLTTRLLDVANQVCSCSPFELRHLNDDKSWDILSRAVFRQEACPSELEHCGKEIARKCRGLPLAIVVIGGLLNVSNRTRENWEHVERNISSIVSVEDDEHCMKILSLSYHQLPIQLKPCFIHLATYSEDSEILVSVVTKLWAADGFLKPTTDGKSLEDVALGCLNELVHRNLIMIKKRTKRGEIKSLIVHDLVRDLCLKEAQKEMLLCADNGVLNFPNTKESQHLFLSHANGCISYRSLIFLRWKRLPEPRSNIWQVLHSFRKKHRIEDVMQFVNVRFLEISTNSAKLSRLNSISLLSNLESLIANVDKEHSMDYPLPSEIWKLKNIKHLVFSSMVAFPDPPPATGVVLENLETLMEVCIKSEEVLHRIPNIKKLKVAYFQVEGDRLMTSLVPRLDHCRKLESLKFCQMGCLGLGNNAFPSPVKKLTLWGTGIPWESMTILGSLPNLEVLILHKDGFVGKEWNMAKGEFQRLTHLTITQCSLVTWKAKENSHFPCLENLELKYMKELEEIPEVFAELMTLVSMRLFRCSRSAIISARQILEEQQKMRNFDLAVEVVHHVSPSKYTPELDAELKGLPNDSFHLKIQQGERQLLSRSILSAGVTKVRKRCGFFGLHHGGMEVVAKLKGVRNGFSPKI